MNAGYSPSTWMRNRGTLIRGPDYHSLWATQRGADHDYVRHVRGFLGRSADTATAEDAGRVQLHQRDHCAGESTISSDLAMRVFVFVFGNERSG